MAGIGLQQRGRVPERPDLSDRGPTTPEASTSELAYTCEVTAPTGTIYPGHVVVVTGTATNLEPDVTQCYFWESDAGPVDGTSNVASFAAPAPGVYTVKGQVEQGARKADCFCMFTVEEPTAGSEPKQSPADPLRSAPVPDMQSPTGSFQKGRPW